MAAASGSTGAPCGGTSWRSRRWTSRSRPNAAPAAATSGRRFQAAADDVHRRRSLALSLGLLAASSLGLGPTAAQVTSAQAKLERVMPVDLKRRVRATDETWPLDFPASGPPAEYAGARHPVRRGAGARAVHLVYEAANRSRTERDLDPYGLAWRGGCWYVVGHCHLRQGPRTFRVDRMTTVAHQPDLRAAGELRHPRRDLDRHRDSPASPPRRSPPPHRPRHRQATDLRDPGHAGRSERRRPPPLPDRRPSLARPRARPAAVRLRDLRTARARQRRQEPRESARHRGRRHESAAST